VSVHTTDPIIRRRLLRNPRAPDVVEQLGMFASGGISFHTQIVLQPGLNDGAVLERSLKDLWELGSAVLSVSVVPVGLTEFSKHALVREPTRDECRGVIDMLHRWSERAVHERGARWVVGSDELYMVAEMDLPSAEWYGDFEQLENGVGSVRYLERQIVAAADRLPTLSGQRIAVVTGMAMARLMPRIVVALEEHTSAIFDILPTENRVFGRRVTTAGLLPGQDIRQRLTDQNGYRLALIPAESLNDNDIFIDDFSFNELCHSMSFPIHASYDFVDVLTTLT
jgi:NifB/MoaA-like Fe-S oxidoreductase